MAKRSIAQYSRTEFDALRGRREKARDGATHTRNGERVTNQDFSHNELPDVIHALYTGGKRGNITEPGSSPGIGSGRYTHQQAYRNADVLYHMRLEADYGPTPVIEPYTAVQADAWFTSANHLTNDLETLL